MYFLLGVLMATLVALLVLPAVWHRAVRLTTRRVEAAVPVSIFEVQADKDQQRAFFALNQRRLELQLDSLRENLVAQAATIETQRQKIHDLQRTFTDLDTRHALLTATGAERDVLLGEVQDQASDRARRIAALEAEATARGDSLATLATELDDARRQIEIARQAHAGAQTQIGTLESSLTARVGELGERTAALTALTTHRDDLDRALTAAKADLDASRSVIHAFEQRRASEFASAESQTRQITGDLERLRADHALMAAALEAARAVPVAEPADAQMLKTALADMAARIVARTARDEGSASPIPGLVAAGTQHEGAPDLAARIRTLIAESEDRDGAGPAQDHPEADDADLPHHPQVAAQ